jgi:toxin secretion/phage lysis holin
MLTTVIYLLGGIDMAMSTLLIFIVVDFITGVCRAIYDKKLNSKIGAKGIIKKIGYLLLVAMSVQIDFLTGNTGTIRTVVIYSFVVNEGISIIENWASMGLYVPKIIKNSLEQIRKNGDKEEVK